MKRSKFFSLNTRDFFKGLLYAAGTAAITFLYNLLQAGPIVFNGELFTSLGMAALSAILAYLGANLFQNSNGEFATEKK
jgi:hypothetical protein